MTRRGPTPWTLPPDDLDALRAGTPCRVIAARRGVSIPTVWHAARRAGHVFDRTAAKGGPPVTFDHAEAAALALAGTPYADLARRYGVSRERVRQVVLERTGRTGADLAALHPRPSAAFTVPPDEAHLSTAALAARHGVSPATVTAARRRQGLPRSRAPRARDPAVLAREATVWEAHRAGERNVDIARRLGLTAVYVGNIIHRMRRKQA